MMDTFTMMYLGKKLQLHAFQADMFPNHGHGSLLVAYLAYTYTTVAQ